MLAALAQSYGGAPNAEDIGEVEREWGLLAGPDYAEILQQCYQREYLPRFAASGIELPRTGALSGQ